MAKTIALLLVALAAWACAEPDCDWYVSHSGESTGDCRKDSPCKTIKDAFLQMSRDTLCLRRTLNIDQGAYTGDGNVDLFLGDANSDAPHYTLKGTGDVTIDGEGHSRILGLSHPTTVELIGITFKNGAGKTADQQRQVIDGVGGCVYAAGSKTQAPPSLVFTKCTFKNCKADKYGGGLYVEGALPLRLELNDCIFEKNEASIGGGGAALRSSETVGMKKTKFVQNKSSGNAGGALFVGTKVRLESCTFEKNKAAAAGGGIYLLNSTGTVTDAMVQKNSATNGAGVYEQGCTVAYAGASIKDNAAENDGGGVSAVRSNSTFTGCTIADNSAILHGGGLIISMQSAEFSRTAAIHTRVRDTRFEKNVARFGGGLFCANASVAIGGLAFDSNTAHWTKSTGDMFCASSCTDEKAKCACPDKPCSDKETSEPALPENPKSESHLLSTLLIVFAVMVVLAVVALAAIVVGRRYYQRRYMDYEHL
mmetsp:Transcript_34484/g.86613  ORF Transcript_34484/g.86613 Transcript_34484/m.86613 type:complete len:480 (-) Transcript_34484:23-1462(-)